MKKVIAVVLVMSGFLFCADSFAADGKEKVNLGEIVVTSSGHEESTFDYPGNVTVITSEEIAKSNANFVPDILRREPGIHVFDQTHTGKTAIVDIRGFGDTANRNVLVMVDGRRLNEIDNSGVDWAQIPLESVERIEILRGAGSVLYGDNASAGVINIITKKGAGKPTIGYDYETGSYRLNKHLASFQGGTPFLQYAGLGKFQETDGYRLNGYFQGYDYDGNVTFNPTDYFSFNLSGAYHKDWSGMPAGLSRTDIDRIGRRGSTTPIDWAKTETGYFKISPVIQLTKNNPDSSLSLDFWKRKRRSTSETHWTDWGGGFARDSMQINSIGGTIKYLIGYDFGPVSNELVLGNDLFRASNRILSVDSMGTYLQLEIRKETFGIYASDKLTILENLILNGGCRYEWAKYVFDEQDVSDDYKLREPDEKAVELGIEYKYTPKGALYGRFSRSYRFPATDEFFSRWTTPKLNADIKQQQAETWEVGIKKDTIKYFKTKLNIFIIDVYNEIYLDPSVGGLGSNKNYDHLRRKGAELSINSDVNKYINLYLAYTYINAYFVDGKFSGNRVPMVPANKVSWGIVLTPFDFMDIHFWSDYVGIQRAINDEYATRPKVKDYTVCNIKASFKCKGWETFFGINNIFNEKYSEYVTSSANNGPNVLYYPAPETNYRFGVSCKF
ncbi:MAG: TonB-dependent receptor [Candidatus Omnitrophica bacterium]|nr:TonB-dependent receptor [Candidatus Omnitrophota bacterium]